MSKEWVSFWRVDELGNTSNNPFHAKIKGFSEPVGYTVRTEGDSARSSQNASSLRDRADLSKLYCFLTIPAAQVLEMVVSASVRPSGAPTGCGATQHRCIV